MKTIKFKNDWRYSRQGDVIEEGDGVALLLIARGIAEEVEPEEDQTEEDATEDADSQEEDVEENQTQENQAEEGAPDGASAEAGAEVGQDGGESALPQIITRQVPGPIEPRSRRGGRG